MKTSIRSRGFELTQALKEYVQRRLAFAFSHLEQSIQRVHVLLSDINGPHRGGVDKRCQIIIYRDRRPMTVVMDTEADLYLAIDRAVARAGRRVVRMNDRPKAYESSEWY